MQHASLNSPSLPPSRCRCFKTDDHVDRTGLTCLHFIILFSFWLWKKPHRRKSTNKLQLFSRQLSSAWLCTLAHTHRLIYTHTHQPTVSVTIHFNHTMHWWQWATLYAKASGIDFQSAAITHTHTKLLLLPRPQGRASVKREGKQGWRRAKSTASQGSEWEKEREKLDRERERWLLRGRFEDKEIRRWWHCIGNIKFDALSAESGP